MKPTEIRFQERIDWADFDIEESDGSQLLGFCSRHSSEESLSIFK